MDYLHYEVEAGPSDAVEVVLDHSANVQLMDTANFNAYKSRQRFRYYGGHATKSPVLLTPPFADRWHVVIDLGGAAGAVRASVRVRKPATA